LIQAGRVLAVSPHLDDAALSVGALLAGLASGEAEVHVVTLFAGPPQEPLSPVARAFHADCGLPGDSTAVEMRHHEDLAAMGVLGARGHHADLLDAVYRRRLDGGWLCDHDRAMFDGMSAAEDIMAAVSASVERFRALVAPDLILTCAAVGGHTDHLLVRTAVMAIALRTETEAFLWEDLPYAFGTTLPPDIGPALRVPAAPNDWARKQKAIACYSSQTQMLWPGQSDWPHALRAHALDRGEGQLAEVLWDATRAPHDWVLGCH